MKIVKAVQEEASSEYVMMEGTSTGKTYLALARRGSAVLGFKSLGFTSGLKFGGPEDTTYLGFKFRSAHDSKLFEEVKSSVSILPIHQDLIGAWPSFHFSQRDKTRASGVAGIFFDGTPVDAPEDFFKNIISDKTIDSIWDYVLNITGVDVGIATMVITPEQFKKWVMNTLLKSADQITKIINGNKKMKEDFKSNIGVFGSDNMKRVADKLSKKEADYEADTSDESDKSFDDDDFTA